jgi:NADPH:quinone reductase-like Zn-dependent oxidoreductase
MNPPEQMRAVWYERFGPASEVLRYDFLPTPASQAGEVLVRVFASSVNPVDTKRRRGTGSVYGAAMPFPRVVPHDDGAGVIVEVGEGVARSRMGGRVWIYLAQARRPYGPEQLRGGRPFGTAAEYVAIPELLALPLPAHVSYAEGSVIGIPAITAHRCSNGQPAIATHAFFAKEAVLRFVYYYVFPDLAFDSAIAAITKLLQTVGLKHPVAKRFPLTETVQAHDETEAGRAVGKHVIDVAGDDA